MAAITGILANNQGIARATLGAPILLLMLLAMVIVPLPPIALDAFFSFNIALALVVLMVSVYVLRPLDFAVFPTVLLVTTLLRLALNVASTRVVLLEGHTGTGAAGRVIEAFGEFVIGGNYAVGLVVFAILVIINFVVVTKGAGRVAEVSARFTLDAMPGKQMAIDADLNAGILTQEEARLRREEVRHEADFYGSMDGASKFVRGDAVAGILILFINIIGGLSIGMLQHGLTLDEALRNYTLLTIGDGLVAQIPALVISTAAAITVTRVSTSDLDMGQQVMGQLFGKPRALGVAAGIIGFMGIIPGMPNVPFLVLAVLCGAAAYYIANKPEEVAEPQQPLEQAPPATPPELQELSWDDVKGVDMIGLEVGYRLISLVDRKQGGELMPRIKGVRKKLSQELGFLVQPVHIRDNLDLAPNAYRISLMGVPVGEAEIHPDRELAINSGQVYQPIEGIATRDPAFGLEALWIEPGQRNLATTRGYTVVDCSTVIATHLSQIIESHAHELLGHEEVQKMLDGLAQTAPKLIGELVPDRLQVSVILKVLQNLLEEHVPIRDLRTIAESLAEQAGRSQDPAMLTVAARVALGRAIIQGINGMEPELPVITLDPALEQLLQQSVQMGAEGGAGIEPGLADQMHQSLVRSVQNQEAMGQPAVLLVSPMLRPWLARLLRHSVPGLHVLSYSEVPDNKQIKVVASVGQQKLV